MEDSLNRVAYILKKDNLEIARGNRSFNVSCSASLD
jgi:hypothetical protein